MAEYKKGDVVTLQDSGRRIIVLKVFPENTGVWGMYMNSYGDISVRGYNRVFLGVPVGRVSIDEIEKALTEV